MRVRLWTVNFLPSALVLIALTAGSCGGSSKGQVSSDNIPSATLPSTLPDPIIVHSTPKPVQGQHYVVQPGDTLSSIAAQFGITTEELMTANGITDPSSLADGVDLVIPSAPAGNAAAPTATPPPAQEPTATPPTAQPTQGPSGGQQTYTVQSGDIPQTIATKFGITADALMSANGITDPASLQVGQVLIIPTPAPSQ